MKSGVWGLPQKGWNLKCSVACKILDRLILDAKVVEKNLPKT